VDVYDNSGTEPRLVTEVRAGHVKAVHGPVPNWLREALTGSEWATEIDRHTTR
jgi:hypothetical protein